jgi:hypothetical protein
MDELHRAAWARFSRVVEGEAERVSGIPPRARLLVSFEWGVWRNGRDWIVLRARSKIRRWRKPEPRPFRVGTWMW